MTTPIIGPLPAVILPGQPVSAAPVMADFNWIVSQVNANAGSGTTLSRVMVTCIGASAMTTAVPMVIGSTVNVGNTVTVDLDTQAEFNSATGLFTAITAGTYQITVNAMGIPPGATFTAEPVVFCRKNGSNIDQPSFMCSVGGGVGFDTFVGSNFAVVSLIAGDTLSATITTFFTGFAPTFQFANLSIVGLG
jgi:hypothetical protein